MSNYNKRVQFALSGYGRVIRWPTVNAYASCAGSREFKSQRPDKSYTALQTVCHRCNIYMQVAALPWRYDATRRWAPQTRYTLRRNTASIMKGSIIHHKCVAEFVLNVSMLISSMFINS